MPNLPQNTSRPAFEPAPGDYTNLQALQPIPVRQTAPTPIADAFAPIAADLERAEQIFASTLAAYDSPIGDLVNRLSDYRGKRLRPALLLLTAKACGIVAPEHHTLAAVVEMIHTATLVHDDVLDEADTRRHSPTINAEWGNKIAILFGDALFTHAFHLSATVDVRACQWIGQATNLVCAGELKQVCERGNLRLAESDYHAIVEGKTAALTEVCGRLGAIYAGSPAYVVEEAASFGRNLGIAFQIADDLLDLTGNERNAGKTLGTDLRQRKMTLPLIHALRELPLVEAESLREAIQSQHPSTYERVSSALGKAGSLVYAFRRAEEHSRAARAALECLPRSEYRTLLERLTEWAIRREN